MLATITVRVDDSVKEQADVILNDIGINITTLFNACLKALLREQRIPFELVSTEYLHRKSIREKLEKSQTIAADPNARRYSHDEVFQPLRDKYKYEI